MQAPVLVTFPVPASPMAATQAPLITTGNARQQIQEFLLSLPAVPGQENPALNSEEVDLLIDLKTVDGKPLFDASEPDVLTQMTDLVLGIKYGLAVMNNDLMAKLEAEVAQVELKKSNKVKEEKYVPKYGSYTLGRGFTEAIKYLTSQDWVVPLEAIHQSPLMEAQRKNIVVQIINSRIRPEVEEGPFKCKDCASRRIRINMVQLRSADEPMTAIMTCSNCGNSWRKGG